MIYESRYLIFDSDLLVKTPNLKSQIANRKSEIKYQMNHTMQESKFNYNLSLYSST